MKKVLSLLICFSLFFCCACKKDDQAPHADDKTSSESFECGTLYTSAGNTYNTHVRMRLANEELVAPVQALIVEIQNDTDCVAILLDKFDYWQCEKWDGGKWTKLPLNAIREIEYTDFVTQRSAKQYIKYFAEPLEKGSYRLQHAVRLSPPNGEDFECMVEVYFTVFPGAPGASS